MVRVIGITGHSGAGKEFVKTLLGDLTGFPVFSISDVLREDIRKSGVEPTRDELIKLGNELRLKYGGNILAKRVIELIGKNAVVDSFKNPFEVEEFRKIFGKDFILLSVKASLEKQFERVKSRGRENDPRTWSEFLEMVEKHSGKAGVHTQLVDECDNIADYFIINNDDLKSLSLKVKALVEFLA